MRYPLVPLVTDLTCPLLFFWFSLPFVMLLILMMIWVWLLLNEAEVPSAEEIKKQFSDEPDSDSKFEDESTEEENQNDVFTIEAQDEMQYRGSLRKLRPKPAYLSSKPKSLKQSLPAAISDGCSQSQKITPSQVEKSYLCNIVVLLCTTFSSLTWNFVSRLLQTSNVLMIQLLPSSLTVYVAQLFAFGEKVVKILSSLRLKSKGLLASVLGRKYKRNGTE